MKVQVPDLGRGDSGETPKRVYHRRQTEFLGKGSGGGGESTRKPVGKRKPWTFKSS